MFMCQPDDDLVFPIITMIDNYFRNYDRPLKLFVRDMHTGRYVRDLCEKAGIELVVGERMSGMVTFIMI